MDLNTANVQTMAKLVGIESAYDLYLWRPYLSWEEVQAVPGFDAARVKQLRAAGAQIKLPGDPRTRRDEQNLPR